MSTLYPRLSSPIGGAHPVVVNRRVHDLLLRGLTGLVPLVIALGVALQVPNPNYKLVVGFTLGALAIIALMASARYEVTVMFVVLYLGLLDGPVKLGSGGGTAASVGRDILIFAISLGALVRLIVKKERIKLPPLSTWVLGFVAIVVAEAFNPNTNGILKVLGGFRQQLEWIPFFFFGYIIMRSKERFRAFFILLGVIALLNGLVSTYQTRISPTSLASWGPGYAQYVSGGKGLGEGPQVHTGLTGRAFSSEGVARVRPPALGSDEGFGGSFGVLALPGLLALLATGALRRRWVAPLLCLGALLAIGTSLQRTHILGAIAVSLAFALLSLSAGRRVTRPLVAVLVTITMAFGLGAVLVAVEGGGTFSHYASIAPNKAGTTTVNYREKTLLQIPGDIAAAPFGVGLATQGSGAGFGGKTKIELEGHGVSGESQYNFVTLELGVLGLILWVALTVKLITLAVRRLPRVVDIELRLYLAAVFAAFIAFSFTGFAGPTMASSVFGPFFWFTVGIAAYWFVGRWRNGRITAAGAL